MNTDIQKAISMFELAAEQGNSYAEYQLGKIYCFGQGVRQNFEQGLDWLKKSAEHGNPYAAPLYRQVHRQLREELISATLYLIRDLAGMLESQGEEQYGQIDWTDSRAKEETNRKKYALGYRYSGPKLRM